MNEELKNILKTYSSILEKKNFINEAYSNSAQIFGGTIFKWGGGPSDHASRPLGNWQSDNAWDIMAPKGTPVYAIEGGVVVGLGGSLIRKGPVWGYQVTIQSSDNSFFYTHLGERSENIKIGANVNKGDLIGFIGAPDTSWPQHVHVGLKYGNINKYMDKSGNLVGHSGENTGSEFGSAATAGTLATAAAGTGLSTSSGLEYGKIIGGPIKEMIEIKEHFSKFINESFGKDVKETYGTLLIPASKNSKILSPVEGYVMSKYSRNCVNELSIKIDGVGYLQFCGISDPKVRDGDTVNVGTLLGKTKDDVEVVFFDLSNNRQKLTDTTFDGMFNKKTKTKDEPTKTSGERRYYDPALAVIPSMISSIFSNKKDDETGKTEKRWGYATDEKPVDPWIVNALSAPFKKVGKALGTNKSVNESNVRKLNENIKRIKGLL